jgi:hypothetical protein
MSKLDHDKGHLNEQVVPLRWSLHEPPIKPINCDEDRLIKCTIKPEDRCYWSPQCSRKRMIAKITSKETCMIATDRWYQSWWCSQEWTITTINGDEDCQRKGKKETQQST